ncbi:hypothetical protein U1Q18_020238, partial [Sarracenia purpurea var. burkii]
MSEPVVELIQRHNINCATLGLQYWLSNRRWTSARALGSRWALDESSSIGFSMGTRQELECSLMCCYKGCCHVVICQDDDTNLLLQIAVIQVRYTLHVLPEHVWVLIQVYCNCAIVYCKCAIVMQGWPGLLSVATDLVRCCRPQALHPLNAAQGGVISLVLLS